MSTSSLVNLPSDVLTLTGAVTNDGTTAVVPPETALSILGNSAPLDKWPKGYGAAAPLLAVDSEHDSVSTEVVSTQVPNNAGLGSLASEEETGVTEATDGLGTIGDSDGVLRDWSCQLQTETT
jgi:hypothetical protein